jgi:hypothetical protein
MGNDLTVRPRMVARVNAGVVLAVFLFLAEATNFPTHCFGHDISMAGSYNFTFGYVKFERTPEPKGELRFISENAPAHEDSARAEGLINSIVNWLVATFDLPVIWEAPRIEFIQPASMAQLRYRGSA